MAEGVREKSTMHRLKLQTGSNIVEFAFVMPLLVILVFGIIDFGIALYDKAVITNAVREGARNGIVFADGVVRQRLTTTEIEAVVSTYCSTYLISFGSSAVVPRAVFSRDGGVYTLPTLSGDTLTVDLSTPYVYHYLILSKLFPPLGDLNLSARSVMRVE
jgi:Flp pilus assembly protein TadG